MTVSIGTSNNESIHRIPPPKSARIRNDKALYWLYENLLSHQLESKLKCLLSDSEHLMNCYDVTVAFFFSKKFVEALYICLGAFTKKQYNLLLQIDDKLYISVIDESIKNSAGSSHRLRYENMNAEIREKKKVINNESMERICDIVDANKIKNCDECLVKEEKSKSKRIRKQSGRHRCKLKHSVNLKIRPWVSLPEIRQQAKPEPRNLIRSKSQTIRKSNRLKLTIGNLAIKDGQRVPSIQLKQRKSATNLPKNQLNSAINDLQPINLVKCDDIKIYTDRRQGDRFTSGEYSRSPKSNEKVPGLLKNLPAQSNVLPFLNTTTLERDETGSPVKKTSANSAPSDFGTFFAANGAKIENRYHSSPFLENLEPNSASVSPLCNHNECMATVPNRAQSLASYLQDTQRTKWNITDLERENAHLILSDAIISAIEEIKCSQIEKKKVSATKKCKSHHKPRLLKNWVIGDDEDTDRTQRNLTDDDTSSVVSEATPISRSSSSGSDLSHISSNSDSTTMSNAGDLKRLKVSFKFRIIFFAFTHFVKSLAGVLSLIAQY